MRFLSYDSLQISAELKGFLNNVGRKVKQPESKSTKVTNKAIYMEGDTFKQCNKKSLNRGKIPSIKYGFGIWQ